MYKLYLLNCKKVRFEDIKWLYDFLPAERKARADALVFEEKKVMSVLEYFVVKKLVKAKGLPDFKYNKFGKPYLKGCKHFNVSHSKHIMVIAVSDNPIGVDIEATKNISQNLINYVCNKKEAMAIKESKDKNKEFTKLWTKKESLIKLQGSTICRNLKTMLRREILYSFDHYEKGEFQICVCQKI